MMIVTSLHFYIVTLINHLPSSDGLPDCTAKEQHCFPHWSSSDSVPVVQQTAPSPESSHFKNNGKRINKTGQASVQALHVVQAQSSSFVI
jgi:hypothetical protein